MVAWLHEDCGYSYTGPTNIGDLTKAEFDMLMLGFLVRKEQAQDEMDDARSCRSHSKSRNETRKLAREKAKVN